jgi:hypothetical protein
MELLSQAKTAGFFEKVEAVALLKTNKDLNALRRRPEVDQFLAEIGNLPPKQ